MLRQSLLSCERLLLNALSFFRLSLQLLIFHVSKWIILYLLLETVKLSLLNLLLQNSSLDTKEFWWKINASGGNGTGPGMRAGTAMRRFPRAASRLTGTGGWSFRRMVFCGLVANLIIIQVRWQICPAMRSVHCLFVTYCWVHTGLMLLSIRLEGPN